MRRRFSGSGIKFGNIFAGGALNDMCERKRRIALVGNRRYSEISRGALQRRTLSEQPVLKSQASKKTASFCNSSYGEAIVWTH
jgi:hypothetical protein